MAEISFAFTTDSGEFERTYSIPCSSKLRKRFHLTLVPFFCTFNYNVTIDLCKPRHTKDRVVMTNIFCMCELSVVGIQQSSVSYLINEQNIQAFLTKHVQKYLLEPSAMD